MEDIIVTTIPMLKELIMQYGLWQISFAITIPILVLILPKLINAVVNLIRVLK